MKLFYKQESAGWNEALPLGNGFLGAMIFGKVAQERIALNEDSLWSGGRPNRHKSGSFCSKGKFRKPKK